jgi:hypothetical protein
MHSKAVEKFSGTISGIVPSLSPKEAGPQSKEFRFGQNCHTLLPDLCKIGSSGA